MGKKAAEALDINYDELAEYLHCNHSVYMKLDSSIYYLTDVNYESWRAQDTSRINEKGHFTDCSELVPTVDEFLSLPFVLRLHQGREAVEAHPTARMQHKSGRYPRGSGRFFVSWAMIGRASALLGKWAAERTGRQAGVPGGPCVSRP